MRSRVWLPSLVGAALFATTLSFTPTPAEARKSEELGNGHPMVEVGRRLFFDPSASRAGKFSCADCHKPEHGFSDPRRFSEDENGKTQRHSQTLIDLKDNTGFHWDGEFDKIEELLFARLAPAADVMLQTRGLVEKHFTAARDRGDRPSEREFRKRIATLTPPYYGPQEPPSSGTPRPLPQPVLARLQHDDRYEAAFRRAFGRANPSTDELVEAMRAYLLSIRSGSNRYDDYLAGQPDALTARERRGLRLFEGKAGCAQCHNSKPDPDGFAKFTDYTFRNTGVAFATAKQTFEGAPDMDAGYGRQTFASADIGSFKVPSLRDVARRAPYMHDGSLESLDDVLDYYEKGGTENGRIDPKLHAFELSRGERADLLAFLHALTSKRRPGLGVPGAKRPETIHVRLMGPDGRPVRGLAVKVTPFGDRLEGGARDAEPFAAESDDRGLVEIPMPKWTHVKLSANGYEIGHDWPIPDTVREPIPLLTVPRKEVYVEVYGPKRGKALSLHLTGQVADAQGTTQGDKITLRRVRSLGGGRVLYATDRIQGVDRVLVRFELGSPTDSALREIDLRGGLSEPLDFRE